jgi:hypothetical protein
LTGSASEGAQSSSRAIATSRVVPPQSSTRVNSHARPSETAKVERSWPIETTTSAGIGGRSSSGFGSPSARRSAKASRSIPASRTPAFLQAVT